MPFLPSFPSPLLGKSYISTKKEYTHPVLIRAVKGEEFGRASSIEPLHMSTVEQNRQACCSVLYGSCSQPLMTLFRIGNI